jgi:hypothetical protein
MPLIRIDAVEGRTQSEVTTLLDAVQGVSCPSARSLPDLPSPSQRVSGHSRHRSRYLSDRQSSDHHGGKQGARRNSQAQVLQGINGAVGELSFDPSKRLMVAIIENSAADWSFGNGEPQFLTGELG